MKLKLTIAIAAAMASTALFAQAPDTSWVNGLANESFNKSDEEALWDPQNKQDQEYLFGKPSENDKSALDEARGGHNNEEVLKGSGKQYTADLSKDTGDGSFRAGYGLFEDSLESDEGVIEIDSYGCAFVRTPSDEMVYVPDAPAGQRIKFDGREVDGERGCQPTFTDAFGATCELQTDQVTCQQSDNNRVVSGEMMGFNITEETYFDVPESQLDNLPLCQDTDAYKLNTNMVRNPGFEEVRIPAGTWTYLRNDMGGWKGSLMELQNNHQGYSAKEGSQYIELNSEGWKPSHYQDIQTIPGVEYTFTLWHRAKGWNGQTFRIRAGDLDAISDGAVQGSWRQRIFTFTAEDAITRFLLNPQNPPNSEQGNFIDDVRMYPTLCKRVPSITVTPEVARQELNPLFNGDTQDNVCWVAGVDAKCTKSTKERNDELQAIADLIGARQGVDEKYLELFGSCENKTIDRSEEIDLSYDNEQRCSTALNPTFDACTFSRDVTLEQGTLNVESNTWEGSGRCDQVLDNLPDYQDSCSFELDQKTSECITVDGQEICSCEKFEEDTGEPVSTCEDGHIGVTPEMAGRLDHLSEDDVGMCVAVEEGLEAQYLPGANDCANGTLIEGWFSNRCELDQPVPAPHVQPERQYSCPANTTKLSSTSLKYTYTNISASQEGNCMTKVAPQCPGGYEVYVPLCIGCSFDAEYCTSTRFYSSESQALAQSRRYQSSPDAWQSPFNNQWKPLIDNNRCPSGSYFSGKKGTCVDRIQSPSFSGYSCSNYDPANGSYDSDTYEYIGGQCKKTTIQYAQGPHCPTGEPSGLVDLETQWDDPMACIVTGESASINFVPMKPAVEILLASNDPEFNAMTASAAAATYEPPEIFCTTGFYPYTYQGDDLCVGSVLMEPIATCAPYEEIKATSPIWGVKDDKVVTTLNIGEITCPQYDQEFCDENGNCFNQAEYGYDCSELENDPSCRIVDRDPGQELSHPLGRFNATEDRTYGCTVEATIEDNFTEDVVDCGDNGMFRCIEDNCFEYDRENDGGFVDAMARLSIVNSLPDDMVCEDPEDVQTCEFFGGEEYDCSYGVGIANLFYGCCPGHEALLNPFEGIYNAAQVMNKAMGMVVDRIEGSVVDAAGYLGPAAEGGTSLASSNTKAFLEINQKILDAVPGWLVNTCDAGATLIMDHAKNEPDVEVMHYGGKYCSEEMDVGFDKICISKREHWCVYNTPFAKVVMDAAAPQFNIDRYKAGEYDALDCRGIDMQEIQNLDWSKIDTEKLAAMMARTDNLPPSDLDFDYGVEDMNAGEFRDRAEFEVPEGW